ncbi:glycoside hydrolase family 95 protein, partial [bacterium]|nr:glycoside hydrolase family 95 protein [bacterium]
MNNTLTLKYPSSWWDAKWREALPTGNGTIAAAAYGAVNNETILLTHDDLWHEVITQELPDVSDRLAKVRRLLAS